MGAARKFIDLAFDFGVLVLGLVILMGGMRRIYRIQDEELKRVLDGGGRLTYVSGPAEECSGSDIISYLLGRDFLPVTFEGTVYQPDERPVVIGLIDVNAVYTVSRQYVSGNHGLPDMLVILKQ